MENVVQTSLDGVTWDDQTGVLTDKNGISGTFAAGPVDAKFVRLNTLSYAGFGEMILQLARLYGPNDPAVTQDISLCQSTWNGGSASCIDPVNPNGHDLATAVDDGNGYWFGDGIYVNATGTALSWPATSGKVIISLQIGYQVEAIGLATISDGRAPRDVDIYLSPKPTGDDTWTLASSLRDLPRQRGDGQPVAYNEIELDNPAVARRVMIEILRTWETQAPGYGQPPSSATLPRLSSTASPSRPRPRA